MKYFNESEFKHFEKLSKESLEKLDRFRALCGKPIHVHSDFRDNSQRHISGKAFDIHVSGMNILDQYFQAERSGLWKGIGLYPCWNNPGLHIDDYKIGRWIAYNSGTKQEYTALNAENIKRYVLSTI